MVKRSQLMTANSLFILALQASFVVGFAVLGPLAYTILGEQLLVLTVAIAYGVAGLFCWVLPLGPAEQCRAGLAGLGAQRRGRHDGAAQGGPRLHPDHHNMFWSLTYLTIVASLIGVLGVLGPDFAKTALGLRAAASGWSCCRWARGSSSASSSSTSCGRYLPRRRLIEGGMLVAGRLAGHPGPGPEPARAARTAMTSRP